MPDMIFTPENRFKTLEKLEQRTAELARFRFVEMQSLLPIQAMQDTLPSGMVHTQIPDRVEGMTIRQGDILAGLDCYWWLRTTVTIPPVREGLVPAAYFDFGRPRGGDCEFEAMLYVDRHPYQGVDYYHREVVLEDLAGQTVELTLLLWSGLPGDSSGRQMVHQAGAVELGYLHKTTDDYYFSARAITETLRQLPADHPDRAGLYSALERSLQLLNWDDDKFLSTVQAAADSLRQDLEQMPKHSNVTVRCVGHTHIDVAWLWRLNHTREKAMRSFATVLHLMDEFGEYLFLQSQPQLYRYLQQDCPELFEKIRKRVAEGRWEPDGGMWLEADCNISSGEALARQFLYGIRFFRKEFGRSCTCLWLPDVFGYSWALPQILKQCGIDTFVTTKISWNEFNTMPDDLFWWKGLDGTRVMTYFITTPAAGMPVDKRYATYSGILSPHSALGTWAKFRNKDLSQDVLLAYGYGDGGGGVDRNMLKMRRAMENLPGLPRVETARAGDFFRELHEKLETTDRYVHTWDGELYLEFHRGTYTNQARNKRWNRKTENRLAAAEWLSVMNWVRGGDYGTAALGEAWEILLRNQFHDIIPGSSIHEVYEDSWKEYEQAHALLAAEEQKALQGLTVPGKDAWTVYHMGSFPRKEAVWIPETRKGIFCTADGKQLTAQQTTGGYWVRMELEPACITGLQFLTGADAPAQPTPFAFTEGGLETPFYTMCWDDTGAMTSLFDKENRREVLAGTGNRLVVFEDKPLNFDAWDIDVFYSQKQERPELIRQPELLENGPVRAVVRFGYQYNRSRITQDMVVYAESRRIDFVTRVDWHEKHRLLKTAFTVDIRSTRATYDIQYGHAERATHRNNSWDWAKFEVVGHKWADLSETGYGVSLLNDCKYGYSILENVMELSLLRSSTHPDAESDMGTHQFTYALLPHTGAVTEGDTIEEATQLNLPACAVPGAAEKVLRPVVLSGRQLVLDAVKKAEDDDSVIVRLHECRGGHGEVRLYSELPVSVISACNLLEEETGEQWTPEQWCVQWKPFEIKTFRLHLRKNGQ